MCGACHVEVRMPYLSWIGIAEILEGERQLVMSQQIRGQLHRPPAIDSRKLTLQTEHNGIPVHLPRQQWDDFLTRECQSAAGRYAARIIAYRLDFVFLKNENRHLFDPFGSHTPVLARTYRARQYDPVELA